MTANDLRQMIGNHSIVAQIADPCVSGETILVCRAGAVWFLSYDADYTAIEATTEAEAREIIRTGEPI